VIRLEPGDCAAIEHGIILEEIRSRTEFNRRVQALQFTLVGAAIAALAAVKFDAIPPWLIFTAGGLISALTVSLFLESNQNNFYIALAASYIDQVFNRRFVGEDGRPVVQWVDYLRARRDANPRLITRVAFFLDAQVFTNSLLMMSSLVIYVVGLYEATIRDWVLCALATVWMLVSCLVFVICLARHFSEPHKALRPMSAEEQALFWGRPMA
jgi:hypothetical protein